MMEIISPRTACRYLRDINDPRLQFRTLDGQALKNLVDLTCYLKACEDTHFRHHVRTGHNHFSNWVDNVILDKHLASQMSLVLDKNPMRIIILKRINILVRHATRTPRGREKARMILENAKLPEEMFITNDGRSLRNLWELRQFLETAPDHSISYHFHGSRNDFHDWVREVIMDIELADMIWQACCREELVKHISERLSYLEGFGVHRQDDHGLSGTAKSISEFHSMFA
jgi:hypothetical protein